MMGYDSRPEDFKNSGIWALVAIPLGIVGWFTLAFLVGWMLGQ